jgi:NAD(P)-dependent dehydrogenase (short-subunit alcohol dehydrogenase family)
LASGRTSACVISVNSITNVKKTCRRDPVIGGSALKTKRTGFCESQALSYNNAGISDRADGPPSAAKLEAVERTLRTNFLGAPTVTQTLLPLLRKSSAGRIVNVSSGLGSLEWDNSARRSS